jgi:hypothetical protein
VGWDIRASEQRRILKASAKKNEFFRKVGERLEPSREETLAGFDDGAKPSQILAKAKP